MKIYVPFSRGFAFNPFVFISKSVKGLPIEPCKVAHEMTHYVRQGLFNLWWLFKYFTDKDFRMQEETLAYRAQLQLAASYPDTDVPAYTKELATKMATGYWGMCTYEEAYKALS